MLPTQRWWSNNEFNIKRAEYEQTKGFCLIVCLNDLSSDSALKRHRSSRHMSPGSLPLCIDVILGACWNFHIFYRCQWQTRFDPTKICQSQKTWKTAVRWLLKVSMTDEATIRQRSRGGRPPHPPFTLFTVFTEFEFEHFTHCHLHTSQYTNSTDC